MKLSTGQMVAGAVVLGVGGYFGYGWWKERGARSTTAPMTKGGLASAATKAGGCINLGFRKICTGGAGGTVTPDGTGGSGGKSTVDQTLAIIERGVAVYQGVKDAGAANDAGTEDDPARLAGDNGTSAGAVA